MKKEEKKWKPKDGEKYYTLPIYAKPDVIEDKNLKSYGDKNRIKFGNCFRTKSEAKSKLSAIKQILKGK